jgi:hypothetical protein
MKVLEKGHIYQPIVSRSTGKLSSPEVHNQTITFINREPGAEHDGTTTQEIIRILLDRTRHCNNCLPHWVNEQVIFHLRSALVLHEMRALQRKFEKGDYTPEYIPTGEDGHFDLPTQFNPGALDTPNLEPYRNDWDRQCNHPVKENITPALVKSA